MKKLFTSGLSYDIFIALKQVAYHGPNTSKRATSKKLILLPNQQIAQPLRIAEKYLINKGTIIINQKHTSIILQHTTLQFVIIHDMFTLLK